MGEQTEITTPSELLDENGELVNVGWMRKPLLKYNRQRIKAPWFRIKEWDYYAILTEDYGIAFTIADLGYIGFNNATLLDFKNKNFIPKDFVKLLPGGRMQLPPSSTEGETIFETKHAYIKFLHEKGNKRIIQVKIHKFQKKNELEGEIVLTQPEDHESITLVVPFPKPKGYFYYNQKINCLQASGYVKLGGTTYEFKKNKAFGVLDWGRGVWPYSNEWYWGSASGMVNNELFGFNIGYGFGDTSKATENAILYKGKVHKLDQVTFNIPEDNFLKPWSFTSNNGRFEMNFTPILDRNSKLNLVFLKSIQHQVFGKYSGKVILDNGEEITVNNLIGFAEKVINKW